jgi:hypothetical protein
MQYQEPRQLAYILPHPFFVASTLNNKHTLYRISQYCRSEKCSNIIRYQAVGLEVRYYKGWKAWCF